MPWYAIVLIAYIVLDRLLTVAFVGHRLEIKPATAVANLITGALCIWAIVALAT